MTGSTSTLQVLLSFWPSPEPSLRGKLAAVEEQESA